MFTRGTPLSGALLRKKKTAGANVRKKTPLPPTGPLGTSTFTLSDQATKLCHHRLDQQTLDSSWTELWLPGCPKPLNPKPL